MENSKAVIQKSGRGRFIQGVYFLREGATVVASLENLGVWIGGRLWEVVTLRGGRKWRFDHMSLK